METDCPRTISVLGHRLWVDAQTRHRYGTSITVTLTHRATRECGHLEDAGFYAGDKARDLSLAIEKASRALAERLGAGQVEIYATTPQEHWVTNIIYVD